MCEDSVDADVVFFEGVEGSTGATAAGVARVYDMDAYNRCFSSSDMFADRRLVVLVRSFVADAEVPRLERAESGMDPV